MSTTYIDVTIACKVWDAKALWRKAYARMEEEIGTQDQAHVEDILGTQDAPDLGACLVMLLDRSENLDGAAIVETTTDYTPDLGDDEDEDE